jgi:hypothetical protein
MDNIIIYGLNVVAALLPLINLFNIKYKYRTLR